MDSDEWLELGDLKVTSVEAEHHVNCLAYRIDVPRGRRFLPDAARELGVPIEDWKRLQRGETVGSVSPSDVLGPPRRGLSLGLVTDTRPTNAIAQLVSGVDLLICEGTYASNDDQPRAVERKHMTFREAALLAREAQTKQLLLTHFSPSVVDPEAGAVNAQEVFANAIVGRDHLTLSLRFPTE
jgi:ribonuclease Z